VGIFGAIFCFLLSFFVVFLVSFLYHGHIASHSQAEEETKEEADIRKAAALSMIPELLYIIISIIIITRSGYLFFVIMFFLYCIKIIKK
jgi:hypothetical protein